MDDYMDRSKIKIVEVFKMNPDEIAKILEQEVLDLVWLCGCRLPALYDALKTKMEKDEIKEFPECIQNINFKHLFEMFTFILKNYRIKGQNESEVKEVIGNNV